MSRPFAWVAPRTSLTASAQTISKAYASYKTPAYQHSFTNSGHASKPTARRMKSAGVS